MVQQRRRVYHFLRDKKFFLCLLKATTPPGVSWLTLDIRFTLLGCSLYSSLYTFLCQKSVKRFTFLKSCRDLHPRHVERVGQGRVGWVSGLQNFFDNSLSPKHRPSQTLYFQGFTSICPHKRPNTLYTVKRKWGRKPSPTRLQLPYPTLSGTYFTLTLHFFPLQNL